MRAAVYPHSPRPTPRPAWPGWLAGCLALGLLPALLTAKESTWQDGFEDLVRNAINANDLKLLNRCLEASPELVKLQDHKNGDSLLQFALQRMTRDDLVLRLIEAGAPVGDASEAGETLMHLAASNSSPAVLDQLQAVGISLDAVTRDGRTPLDYAIGNGNYANTVCLLEHGAAFNRTTSLHGPPITTLCYYYNNQISTEGFRRPFLQAVELLLQRGSEVNGVDPNGLTALHYAVSLDCSAELLPLLLSHGADPNAGAYSDSPLYLAVANQDQDAAAALIAAGASAWRRSATTGLTPLGLLLNRMNRRAVITRLTRLDRDRTMLGVLYAAQENTVNWGILAALGLTLVTVGLYIRRWIAARETLVQGAEAEKALDAIAARPDWQALLAKFEQAQKMQRRVFLHRPWILVGAIGWVGGVALLYFDPVLELLMQPGAWWLLWLFTGTFLFGCSLQFSRRSGWRIFGASLGIVTLAVSCFYAGVGAWLIWSYSELHLLAATFAAMVLATLTAAWRFHRTLKAEMGLRRIKLPAELELARLTHDGAGIDHPGGWDETAGTQ